MRLIFDALGVPLNTQKEMMVNVLQGLDCAVVGHGCGDKSFAKAVWIDSLVVRGVDAEPPRSEDVYEQAASNDFDIMVGLMSMPMEGGIG